MHRGEVRLLRAWTAAVAALLAALVLMFLWFYRRQGEAHARADASLVQLQYASDDLTDGLTQLLAHDDELARARGRFLLLQTADELARAAEVLRSSAAPSGSQLADELDRDLARFRQMVRALHVDRAPPLALRLAATQLQQLQHRASDHIRSELQADATALQRQLYVGIAITVVVLAAFAVRLSMAAAARARAMRAAALAAEALRTSEHRLRALFEATAESLVIGDATLTTLTFTPPRRDRDGTARATWTVEEWLLDVHPDDRAAVREALDRGLRARGAISVDLRVADPAPSEGAERAWRFKHLRGTPLTLPDGGVREWLAMVVDLTERRALEDQLRHALKLDAVGQLAGGVAHDFNNLLAIVLGNLELLQEELHDESQRAAVQVAIDAATRGGALTRQLLAFARRQTLAPQPIDLGPHVDGLVRLLRRTVGDGVTIEVVHPHDAPRVHVDPGQLDNAVVNLCVNARDAMAGRGTLTLTVSQTDARSLRRAGVDGASALSDDDVVFVALAIADTGAGMSPAVAARAFEPFFTTKPAGQGNGLGLAMVHGFVRQSQGLIELRTAEGQGTTFTIYLPAARDLSAASAAVIAPVSAPAAAPSTPRRVLVVDDNEDVREAVRALLVDLDHDVITAGTAAEALRHLDSDRGVEVIITDLDMPGDLDGLALIERARQHARAPGVVLMSGTELAAEAAAQLAAHGGRFLKKPFRRVALAEVIGAAAPGSMA